jgi:hypothetical protein
MYVVVLIKHFNSEKEFNMSTMSIPPVAPSTTTTANPTDAAITELVALTKDEYGNLSEKEFDKFLKTPEGKLWSAKYGNPTFADLNTDGNKFVTLLDLSVQPPSLKASEVAINQHNLNEAFAAAKNLT